MMKRTFRISFYILIVTILIVSLFSCTENKETSIVGTWEYSNHSELKDFLTDVFEDSYFYKVYYQFDEDGTGKTWLETSADFKAEFTYTFDGKVLAVTLQDGSIQKLECEFHGDYFYISDGEENMKFEKID